jgi:YesN/AraC family two-component response regulator
VVKTSIFIVEETENGKEAMETADSSQPDLIFMDIKLPDESGPRLTFVASKSEN